MKTIWLLIGMLSFIGGPGATPQGKSARDAGLVSPRCHEHPEWFKGSVRDIREGVAEATEQGRVVLRTDGYFPRSVYATLPRVNVRERSTQGARD